MILFYLIFHMNEFQVSAGVSTLLENLNIKENIKDDSLHLDIETALESLKFQVNFNGYL